MYDYVHKILEQNLHGFSPESTRCDVGELSRSHFRPGDPYRKTGIPS